MASETDGNIAKLKEAVETDDRCNEVLCAELLTQIAWVLLPPGECSIFVKTEQNTSAGRSDLFVVADETMASGGQQRVAYVWELKAPQIEMFKIETNDRARPSDMFYDAENKLISYLGQFAPIARRYEVFNDQIRFGGIIISRRKNLCQIPEKIKISKEEADKLADENLRLRQSCTKIKVKTWDDILDLANKQKTSHQKYSDPYGHVKPDLSIGKVKILKS